MLRVTVHDTHAAAADTARAWVARLAAHAGIGPAQLGLPGDITVRPGWRRPADDQDGQADRAVPAARAADAAPGSARAGEGA